MFKMLLNTINKAWKELEPFINHIEGLTISAFVFIVTAYSFAPLMWVDSFFHLTALTFVLLTRVIFLRSIGSFKLFSLIMHITAVNSLLDELFFNPEIIDYNEYFTFAICVCIVCKNRDKWSK